MSQQRVNRCEGEAASGEGRGREEETETQRTESRAKTTQPQRKCQHGRRKEAVRGLRGRQHLRAQESQGSV
jgi:hypothetical protein